MRGISKVAKSSGEPDRPSGGWGGARNNTVTRTLSAKQVMAVRDAADRAIVAGRPFNRFTTVHWGALGVLDIDAARMTGRLIKLASDWCATKGEKMTWVWVRENDEGDRSKGSHVHILLHCPVDLPIGRMWRRWLRRVTGRAYKVDGVFSRSVGPTLATYANNPAIYRENLNGVLNYMTKGSSGADLGGWVIGKRISWWQRRNSKLENLR